MHKETTATHPQMQRTLWHKNHTGPGYYCNYRLAPGTGVSMLKTWTAMINCLQENTDGF